MGLSISSVARQPLSEPIHGTYQCYSTASQSSQSSRNSNLCVLSCHALLLTKYEALATRFRISTFRLASILVSYSSSSSIILIPRIPLDSVSARPGLSTSPACHDDRAANQMLIQQSTSATCPGKSAVAAAASRSSGMISGYRALRRTPERGRHLPSCPANQSVQTRFCTNVGIHQVCMS